jgi:hypothetical protein
MLGFSFWSLVARLWPRQANGGRRPATRSHLRPDLEQLSDRTLLSTLLGGFAPGAGFGVPGDSLPAALVNWPQGSQTVVTANATVFLDAVHMLSDRLAEAVANGDVTVAPVPDSQGRGIDVTDPSRDGRISILFGATAHVGSENFSDNPETDAIFQMQSFGQLQHLQFAFEDGGGERFADIDFVGPLEIGRPFGGPERLWNDQGAAESVVRPYLEERGDRRETIDDGQQADDADDDARPDATGSEALLSERSDGLGIARSLAAVFREQVPGENPEEEAPAETVSDLLVSYEPDLPAQQAELLPLEDGSRALVAALVAGVPADNPDAPSDVPTNPDATLSGVPFGIDSGSPSVRPAPAPTVTEREPGVVAEAPADAEQGAPEAARPAVRLLDALFAAGVVHIYLSRGDADADDRRRGPSR